MKLNFKIHDGKKKRYAETYDLELIFKFGLGYHVLSTRRKFFLFRYDLPPTTIETLYVVSKHTSNTNNFYSFVDVDNLVRIYRIGLVLCPELHKYKNNKLVGLALV